MKLFSKIATALVGMAMAVGVGVAVSGNNSKEVRAADGSVTIDNASTNTDGTVTVAISKASGSSAPITGDYGVRLYANNTVTISSSSTITALTIPWTKNSKKGFATVTADVGTYSHPSAAGNGTWSGSANTVVLTVGSSGQIQFNAVNYTVGGSVVTYTISYDANGGTGTMEDTTNTVAACTFTAPEGKSFSTWNTAADGSGTDYAPGATATSDLDLFAIWVDKPTVVTLDKIGTALPTTANTTMETVDISDGSDTYTLNYLQCKKQGDSMFMTKNVNPFISNHTEIPGAITSVEVFINSGASGSTTYDVAFGTSEYTTATAGIGAVNITGGNSHVFENEDVTDATYFCITLGNANNGQVLKIVVSYEASSEPKLLIQDTNHSTGPFEMVYNSSDSVYLTAWDEESENPIKEGLTWTFSNNDVVNHVEDSFTWTNLTPKGVGSVDVTVSHEGYKSATTKVTVTPGTLTGITVTGSMSKTSYTESEAWSADGFTVTASYDSGASVNVTSDVSWSWDPTAPLEGVTSVVATATYGGKTANSTAQSVTVTPTASTPLSSFFDGTITLKKNYKDLTADDWYTVKGTVVGIYGYQYYIQEGEYGMLLYNDSGAHYTYYDGIALGDYVRIYTRVYSYNGIVESNKSDNAQTVVKLGTKALPDAAEYTSVSTFMAAHQSIRASLSNTAVDATNISTIAGFSGTSTSDQKFKVYDVNSTSDTTTVLIHKSIDETNKTAIVDKLKTITEDDTVEFVRTVVAYYNGNQISLASADQIIIHTPSEDKLAAWGVNYLFIGDPSFDGDGTGLCKSANLYKDAKTALFALEAEESGSIDKLQEDDTYADELARYLAWAKACGDNAPFVNDFGFLSSINNSSVSNNNLNSSMSIVVVAVIAITSLSAIGVLLVIKRRKSI